MIHGFCFDGGLELALCCDLRFAEENLSVFPGNGGIWRSMYHLPFGKLKELVYSEWMNDWGEAFRLGLIEKVVPVGRKIEASFEFVTKIMEKGPLGVRAAKKVINRVRD